VKTRFVGPVAVVTAVAAGIVVLFASGILPGTPPPSPSYAATTPSTWVSGISVMNQGSSPATIMIEFYDQSGTRVTVFNPPPIPPGGMGSYYSPTQIPGLPDRFVGSAVVSSDQPVVAIVNTQTPSEAGLTKDNPLRIGSSSGVNTPSTTLYFPQVERHFYGWNSSMYVQNTSGTPATANVQFTKRDGTVTWSTSVNIPAYSMASLNQADESALGEGWVGAAVVSSSAPLAGIANAYNDNSSVDKSQIYSYNAFSRGSTKLYFVKVVKNYYSFYSGLTIQNIGNAPTTVTVTYYMHNYPTPYSHSQLLQPKQPWVIYTGNTNPGALPSGLPNTYGSAIATSDGQPIVGIVNEEFGGSSSDPSAGFGTTLSAFVDGEQTNTVLFPKVSSRYYGYASGFQIQNAGTSPAYMYASLVGRDGRTASLSSPGPVDPGSQWAVFLPDALSGWLNFDGSATVTSSQPIVGTTNFSYRYDKDSRYGMRYGDTDAAYNGLNK